MEDTFNKLKKDGKNTVDNLISWMKDSKIVDGVKVTEESARKLFEDVKDVKNVEFDKFKEVLTKLATEQHKNFEEFSKNLATEGSKLLKAGKAAASAAASAFKRAMAK